MKQAFVWRPAGAGNFSQEFLSCNLSPFPSPNIFKAWLNLSIPSMICYGPFQRAKIGMILKVNGKVEAEGKPVY